MSAKRMVIDFSAADGPEFKGGKMKSLDAKQIRARARRRAKMSKTEFELLYKPIEEWDEEELARGRPRNKAGTFSGRPPRWMSRQVFEEAMARYKGFVEEGMRSNTVEALNVVRSILLSNDVDDKGKPVVPASTKLEAAKFLLEHVVGKPTQRQEVDISVRLQALLATATVGPVNAGVEALALPGGSAYADAFGGDTIDAEVIEDGPGSDEDD